MNCRACGSEVPKEASACSSCGTLFPDLPIDEFEAVDPDPMPAREAERPGDPWAEAPTVRPPRSQEDTAAWEGTPEVGKRRLLAGEKSRFHAGTVLADRYRIVSPLGKGAMGEVYRADDLKLGLPVALKFLPEVMERDEDRLERFFGEVKIARRVSHPNVCQVYDVGEVDGHPFLSMECIDGEDLSSLLRRIGRLPPAKAIEIGREVAGGLAAIHREGILHRDLKPANLMIDGQGRARITDFGIAAMARSIQGEEVRVGTPAYMAPEQHAGEEVSVQSDLYALGLVLFELLAGRRAFKTPSPALRPPPPSVVKGLDPAVERAILRCLEPDPSDRPASAEEVTAALWDSDSSQLLERRKAKPAPATRPAARPPAALRAALAVVLAAMVLAAVYWLGLRPGPDGSPRAGDTDRASVAVLYFQNLTGDPDLDWLRTGITHLLVTDLSQSPGLDVYAGADELLNTGELYQILQDLDALDEPTLSSDLVRGLAERAAVETVVRGGYASAGDFLRIILTIEDAASGKILRSHSVDDRAEERLFAMVDELGAAVRNSFDVPDFPEETAAVEEATTSSLEAWRLYCESLTLEQQFKRSEAAALLEEAVEIDPGFALALANLGRLYGNLGRAAAAREHTRRAVELVDRLPLDERYRVEGIYHGARWTTYGRAIEVYRRGLELFPHRQAWRNNLARRYAFLERYEEALVEFERLIAEGTDWAGTYSDAADVYAALDRRETGYRVLSESAASRPDNWFLQYALGAYQTGGGRFDEAAAHFARAAKLRPGERAIRHGRWQLAILRGDWRQAELEAGTGAPAGSFGRWQQAVARARTALYRGRSGEAADRLREAVAAYPEPGAFTALARCFLAELLLDRGEAAAALAEARRAQEEGREEWPELRALFLAALAEQDLGRPAAADAIVDVLRQGWKSRPNRVEERQLHRLVGRLALRRGDPAAAVEALSRAASLLPSRGVKLHRMIAPDHLRVWLALGEAELAAGRPDAARPWLERAAASGFERLEQPVPYVRSFYFLGRVHQELGDRAEARSHFEQFLGFWRDGDLDRSLVEEAALAARSPGRRPAEPGSAAGL